MFNFLNPFKILAGKSAKKVNFTLNMKALYRDLFNGLYPLVRGDIAIYDYFNILNLRDRDGSPSVRLRIERLSQKKGNRLLKLDDGFYIGAQKTFISPRSIDELLTELNDISGGLGVNIKRSGNRFTAACPTATAFKGSESYQSGAAVLSVVNTKILGGWQFTITYGCGSVSFFGDNFIIIINWSGAIGNDMNMRTYSASVEVF